MKRMRMTLLMSILLTVLAVAWKNEDPKGGNRFGQFAMRILLAIAVVVIAYLTARIGRALRSRKNSPSIGQTAAFSAAKAES